MVRFAHALPDLRDHVEAGLDGDEMTRERVLACAVRLLDRGFFRIGSEQYAVENQSYGLATMCKEHVTISGDEMVFDYPAKSGVRRVQAVVDPQVSEIVAALKRRRGGGEELLAFKEGRRWRDVRSDDINAYLKEATGDDFSAKDFRTWNATVLAAVALSVSGRGGGHEDRPQAGDHARDQGGRPLPRQHAGRLPRVLHRPARVRRLPGRPGHRQPLTGCRRRASCRSTTARLEEAVLDLLDERERSRAIERVAA